MPGIEYPSFALERYSRIQAALIVRLTRLSFFFFIPEQPHVIPFRSTSGTFGLIKQVSQVHFSAVDKIAEKLAYFCSLLF